jgi:hypothetical protein
MSVMNDHSDELIKEFNELESKVMILIENMQTMDKRIKALEQIARKHGINVKEEKVEADTCTIN